MDGLDQAINRAQAFERVQAEKVEEFAKEAGEDKAAGSAAAEPAAGEDMAESLLKIGASLVSSFVDPRLEIDEKEILACRAGVGPVLSKYGLVAGDGVVPFAEEIGAGMYLGGLWVRFRRALRELRKVDEAEKQAREKANDGNKRKHGAQEPAQPVSGEVGVWEITNAATAGGNPFIGGEGSAVGCEQGSSGA